MMLQFMVTRHIIPPLFWVCLTESPQT